MATDKTRHFYEPGAYAARVARKRERERAESAFQDASATAFKWWHRPEGSVDVSTGVWAWAERLKDKHRRRVVLDALWEAIYKDSPTNSLDGDSASAAHRLSRARQNIAKSMVDTVTARLAKRRPMPIISADDAGFSEKLFARRSSRILRRKLGQSAVERLRPLIARDGVIRGSGVAKAFRNGGDVSVDRVPRREILVDPVESQYGPTRTMAHCRRMDRDVLRGMFPDREKDIDGVGKAMFDDWRVLWADSFDVDHVDVIEAWHLPSVPGAKDGRHVICIRGCEPLLDMPWKRARFPFSFFHWEPPVDGFWGVGLIESLGPIQMEVNRMLGTMAEGIEAQMALKVFAQRGSGVEKAHMRAGYPVYIEYDGQEPHIVAPTPFSQPVLQYIQWRIQQAYELSGVSQASAASKNPLGSNASGKALDTMYDLESDRFSDRELNYAMFAVDLGMCILDEARDIAADEDTPDAEKARWIRENDWDKVDIDEGEYHLVLEPVNFLPEARGGRLAQVKEMTGIPGLLTNPMQVAALFDEPDIARANRQLLGPFKMLERWCEELADVSVPLESLTPTPQMVAHVELATQMCEGELCNVIAEGADEEVQGRYRWALQMLEQESARLSEPEPQNIPPPAPPGGTPGPMPPQMPGLMPGGMPGEMPGEMPMPMPMDPALLAGAMPPDAMGGLTSQLAAGMPVPPGVSLS